MACFCAAPFYDSLYIMWHLVLQIKMFYAEVQCNAGTKVTAYSGCHQVIMSYALQLHFSMSFSRGCDNLMLSIVCDS